MNPPPIAFKPRMLHRVLGPILFMIFCGMVLTVVIAYLYTEKSVEALVVGQMRQTLHALDKEVQGHLEEVRSNLTLWSREEVFKLALGPGYLGRSARKAADKKLAQRLSHAYDQRLLLVDGQGLVVASSNPEFLGVTVAEQEYFKRALAGETVVETVASDLTQGRPVLFVAAPVEDSEHELRGVLALALDVVLFGRSLLDETRFGLHGGGSLFYEGRLLALPSFLDPGDIDVGPYLEQARAATANGSFTRYSGYDTERLALACHLKDCNWDLAVTADVGEVLAPAARLAAVSGLVSLGVLGLVALALYILKKAMARLRDSEARYRAVTETSPVGIATFNVQGGLTYINERGLDIFGPDVGSVDWQQRFVGRAGLPLSFESLPMATALRHRTRRLGKTLRYCHPLGGLRILSISAAFLASDSDETSGVVAAFEDITKLKQAEQRLARLNHELEAIVNARTRELQNKAEELRQANERLTELDTLKSSFLSTVSHELRTPLTSILGFVKLINRDFRVLDALPFPDVSQLRKVERIRRNLSIIAEEGDRLTRLINDFLDLSKIESGQAQWHNEPTPASRLLTRAADSARGLFSANPDVTFAQEIPENLPVLSVDGDRFVQVVLNLLSNAAKYTSQGCVTLRALPVGPFSLRVSVADTGLGIPPEELDRVFESFHQVTQRESEDRKIGGTGLGLAICRQIVEYYNGRIWVESEIGTGSVFHFELPTWTDAIPAQGI